MARKATSKTESTANLGFEQKLWLAADKLRNNMDAAEPETASRRLPTERAKRGNFVESHGGQLGDISIYGQEKRVGGARFGRAQRARRVRLRRKQPNQSNPTTRRLAIMNIALN